MPSIIHYYYVRSFYRIHRGNYYSVDRLTSTLHESKEVVKEYLPFRGIIQLIQLKQKEIKTNESRHNIQDK